MEASDAMSSCVLLLAGGLRSTPLEDDLALPTLMLSASEDATLLEEWKRAALGATDRALTILTRNAELAKILPETVNVVRDSDEYRGTAGAVRDAAAKLTGDVRTLLVCEGRRRPAVPLGDVLAEHAASGRAVSVACAQDGGFLGIYAIEADLLTRSVGAVGYQDLKEQWLKRAADLGAVIGAARFAVRGHAGEIHRREDLLLSAGVHRPKLRYRDLEGLRADAGVVSRAATVHGTARLRDSVIMGAARVDEEAVVYRSILGPSAHVRAGEVVVNRVVA
ncbi:MAG: hypothetical protein CMJ31_10410 [Phycisphaerae bacterium]|nr:hypothetical protein [Phycisphaerae bacterium]